MPVSELVLRPVLVVVLVTVFSLVTVPLLYEAIIVLSAETIGLVVPAILVVLPLVTDAVVAEVTELVSKLVLTPALVEVVMAVECLVIAPLLSEDANSISSIDHTSSTSFSDGCTNGSFTFFIGHSSDITTHIKVTEPAPSLLCQKDSKCTQLA